MDLIENIDTLILNARKKGTITFHKFKYNVDGEEQKEGEDYILKHRGFTIKSSDITIISVGVYNFLWIKNMGKDKNYIYFSDDWRSLMVESDEYDHIKGIPIVCINLEDKKYCIELTTNEFNFLYINFITTLPKGCNNKECQRLRGVFAVLYKFLINIKYTGPVSLRDDSQYEGKFIVFTRAMEKKSNLSIYEKYGFIMSKERRDDIMKAVYNNDIKQLLTITRNIPMIANNINNFYQCFVK